MCGARCMRRRQQGSVTVNSSIDPSLIDGLLRRLQFGGSSVASAERMMEVADIVCSFPEHLPCVVLSAMGKVGVGRCAARQLVLPP